MVNKEEVVFFSFVKPLIGCECIKKLVLPYDIKMLPLSQINIFEHALLQWAKIKEFPLSCERTHHNIVDNHPSSELAFNSHHLGFRLPERVTTAE